MSGTMSTTNNQWQQLYQNNQPTMVQTWCSEGATNATNNTNTTNTISSISNQLSRVTRPTNTRRRSRASRRTPTTLLNTDTTNFRAMVQRFTGGGNTGGDHPTFHSNESSITSAHHFLNTYNSNSTSFNDGVGLINPGVVPRVNEGYNMQFRPPHSQPYFTMTVDDGGSTTAVHDGDDGFRHRGSYI